MAEWETEEKGNNGRWSHGYNDQHIYRDNSYRCYSHRGVIVPAVVTQSRLASGQNGQPLRSYHHRVPSPKPPPLPPRNHIQCHPLLRDPQSDPLIYEKVCFGERFGHNGPHHCPITDTLPNEPDTSGEKCRDCMTRIPYATLIATLMCCVGVGVFCGTMYRGTTLTLLMFDEVFRIKITWVEPVQLTFMIVGAAMGGLGLMILFLGCLSTGSTRAKVYRTWRGRVGGRVSCAIFMGITYLLSIIWLLMFGALVVVTLLYTVAWIQCQTIPEKQCIDYNQFDFMFPSSTTEEDRRVCPEERKVFCKDCVSNAEVMFILATSATFLVIISLIHYSMCLAANYAHIKDQEKFLDLQDIQYLQESEMSTLPKDRF